MELSKDTHFSIMEIKGVSFEKYKHWSYAGNMGIYLPDREIQVGEIVDDKIVYSTDFTEATIAMIRVMYPDHFAVIFPND